MVFRIIVVYREDTQKPTVVDFQPDVDIARASLMIPHVYLPTLPYGRRTGVAVTTEGINRAPPAPQRVYAPERAVSQ